MEGGSLKVGVLGHFCLIFNDFHWFLTTFIDFRCFSSIPIEIPIGFPLKTNETQNVEDPDFKLTSLHD